MRSARGSLATSRRRPLAYRRSRWSSAFGEASCRSSTSIDAANELIGALVMGLWNRLARHQDRRAPFRLIRTEATATRAGLAAFALVRQQELDGFIEGLFGSEEKLDFPERAHRGLGALAEIRSLFAGVIDVALDETRPGTSTDMETTVRLMREMTRNAEHEIHEVVLSCARARRQMLRGTPVTRPTLH